jgi:hypothetical protein
MRIRIHNTDLTVINQKTAVGTSTYTTNYSTEITLYQKYAN